MSTYNGESAEISLDPASVDFGLRRYKRNRGTVVDISSTTTVSTTTTYFCKLSNGSYQSYSSIGSIPLTAIILRIVTA